MTTNFHAGSAKIYEFPARGRFAAGGRPDENRTPTRFTSPHVADVVFGSSWYHEEAIQEERGRQD
jgi:hypothetical protein